MCCFSSIRKTKKQFYLQKVYKIFNNYLFADELIFKAI